MALNQAQLRYLLSLAAALVAAPVGLVACVPSSSINLEIVELGFNEVLELQRRGSDGRLGDARFGPLCVPKMSSVLIGGRIAYRERQCALSWDSSWSSWSRRSGRGAGLKRRTPRFDSS
jgi:hypothetical protein